MTTQATFALRGHNPDVLTCIANLSNDEVFTPPELANEMLDTLERAWAEANGGASIWADPTVTFLDPFTKSGVFLREITKRLIDGLEAEIPDLQERVDHILTKQVFGIAITELTALLARRSVYCSKFANGKHSVASSFETEEGNIWFERTEHSWEKRKRVQRVHPTSGITETVDELGTGRCRFCGAAESEYARDDALETHAYAFIHTDNIKARIAELFGADMQFDVIIGNPPYQMGAAGGTGDGEERVGRLRDIPIYHRFVEQAKRMEPRFIAMVTPSRWMAGGLGLSEYRGAMLGDRRLRVLVDYPQAGEVFPGVEIKGGVSYFLWDLNYRGDTLVTLIRGTERTSSFRRLDEFDVLVRDSQAIGILRKVRAVGEDTIPVILSADKEFGWTSNFGGFRQKKEEGDIPLYYNKGGKRLIGFIGRNEVPKSQELVDTWKVMIASAGSGGGVFPDIVLSKPFVAPGPSVCTQTYLFFRADSPLAAESIRSYLATKFLRFLVNQRKITQHASPATYGWVPMQSWDRTWTDAELYEKYGLTDGEIAFIESMIRPMELDGE